MKPETSHGKRHEKYCGWYLWMISTIGQAFAGQIQIYSTVLAQCEALKGVTHCGRGSSMVAIHFRKIRSWKGDTLQAVMVYWKMMTGSGQWYSERQTSAMAELGMGMSQHLKEEKCLQISHCTDFMRKGIEVLIFCQASLLVIAIDDRFQWKSSMVSNLKHISKSIWLVAVTANHFCWCQARH